MKFIPFYDKVEIEPIERKTVIATHDKQFHEMGKVIAVGDETKSIKVGDIVCFNPYGCSKTPADDDGIEHYVVQVNEAVIYGVLRKE